VRFINFIFIFHMVFLSFAHWRFVLSKIRRSIGCFGDADDFMLWLQHSATVHSSRCLWVCCVPVCWRHTLHHHIPVPLPRCDSIIIAVIAMILFPVPPIPAVCSRASTREDVRASELFCAVLCTQLSCHHAGVISASEVTTLWRYTNLFIIIIMFWGSYFRVRSQ